MGSSVSWSITLSNGGASQTGAMHVTVRTESAADGIVSSTEAGCSATASAVYECDIAPLAAGATRLVTFTTALANREFDLPHNIRIDEFGGGVTDLAFTLTSFDPANPPDARVRNVSVVAVPGQPDVFDVTWRVDNAGGRARIEWAMTMLNAEFVSSAPGGCNLQSPSVFCGGFAYEAGASFDPVLRLKAGSGRPVTASISLHVQGPVPDKDTSNNYASVVVISAGGGGSGGGSTPPPSPPTTHGPGSVDASVTLAASRSRIAPGDRVTVSAEVRTSNYRPPSNGGFLVLRVTLPEAFTLESATVSDGPSCTGTRIVACEAGLVSRTSPYVVELVLTARSSAASVVRARLDVPPIGADSNPTNNVARLELNPLRAVIRSGTAGPDTLRGTPLGDRLYGRGGRDSIFGLGGDDLLVGGAQVDSINGGAGADRIESHDGERDTIVCGAGPDVVIADLSDRIARDCELVKRR